MYRTYWSNQKLIGVTVKLIGVTNNTDMIKGQLCVCQLVNNTI